MALRNKGVSSVRKLSSAKTFLADQLFDPKMICEAK